MKLYKTHWGILGSVLQSTSKGLGTVRSSKLRLPATRPASSPTAPAAVRARPEPAARTEGFAPELLQAHAGVLPELTHGFSTLCQQAQGLQPVLVAAKVQPKERVPT